MFTASPQSEPSFQELVDTLQVGGVVLTPTSQIVFCNQRALDLLGLSKDQLLGCSSCEPDWSMIGEDGAPFPAQARPAARAFAEQRAIHDVVMGVELPRAKARVWLLVHANPLFDSDGCVRQVVVTFSDITERKEAEAERLAALGEAQEKIRRLSDFYNVLAQCHAAIGRTNRLQVLNEICRIIVTVGGLDVASIGLLDPVNQRIVPVASFGDAQPASALIPLHQSPPAHCADGRSNAPGERCWTFGTASPACPLIELSVPDSPASPSGRQLPSLPGTDTLQVNYLCDIT